MPQGSPAVTAAAQRLQLIESARNTWISKLIDVSRRNNLLYFKPIQWGSVELDAGSPGLLELLLGKPTGSAALFAKDDPRPGRVLSISRKAQENSEEKGVQTLYLALGFARWTAGDGGRDVAAPVFLLPLQMRHKGRDLSTIEVQFVGEPKLNPVLRHVLDDEFDVDVSEEEMLAKLTARDESEEDAEPSLNDGCQWALQSLREIAADVPGFQADARAAISNFSFAKLALVNDLRAATELLTSNDVVAAIAGDEDVRGRLASSQKPIDPLRLDNVPPDAEFCVVEADSSQQCAISGIAAGQNAVVHGPPGTGKSQTITNLIATLVANGKTVLFVAEKRAALEVVQQRLAQAGLSHVAMDLHGAESTPKKIMDGVARTLGAVRTSKPVQADVLHQQFADRRDKLNAHDRQMHAVSDRAGRTAYDLQGALLRLPADAKTSVRWRGAELAQLDAVKASAVRDNLREASPFVSLFLRQDTSPWTGVSMPTPQSAQTAMDLVARLVHETLPRLQTEALDISRTTGFATPEDFAAADALVVVLKETAGLLDRYSPDVFTADIPDILTGLEKVKDGGLGGLWASLTNATAKKAKQRAKELRTAGAVGPGEAFRELTAAQALLARWKTLSGDRSAPMRYERLGWTFHRIWSTDWFNHRGEEVERVMAAYERAVARADAPVPVRAPEPLPELAPEITLEELKGKRSSVFPPIPKRGSIADYTHGELRALYEWVASDGQLRTHEEVADEMFDALPFARRGARIEAALQQTIRSCDVRLGPVSK